VLKHRTDYSKLIYELSEEEFEKFVFELLREAGFSNVRTRERAVGRLGGFLAELADEPVGIEVKHRKTISPTEFKRVIEDYFLRENLPRHLVLVTSAKITSVHTSILETFSPNLRVTIFGLDELQNLISIHADIAKRILGRARLRLAFNNFLIVFTMVLLLVVLVNPMFPLIEPFPKQTPPLDRRIQNVESALRSIRDLEVYLDKIKEDMVATERATKEINEHYAKAKELQKLTDDQIEVLKQTLQTERWWKTLMNYGIGFVLGTAASLLAGILHARWKHRKALKSD
jgi:hypothetical protein